MMWVSPQAGASCTDIACFDFPVLDQKLMSPDCKSNVAPAHTLMEHLYASFGKPGRDQGLPCLVEKAPGLEDPNKAPWLDAIIHMDEVAVLFHTGRLSGDMADHFANAENEVRVTIRAVPVGGGDVQILVDQKSIGMAPAAGPVANNWYWYHDPTYPASKELVCTIKQEFTPTETGTKPWKLNETYKLVVDWNFYYNKKPELFHGFDDTISFHVSEKL